MFECWLNDLIGDDITKPVFPSKYTEDVYFECKKPSIRVHNRYFRNEEKYEVCHEPD